MIAADLQKDLAAEITRLFQEMTSLDAQGNKVTGVTGYYQQLPAILEDEDEPSKYFPYFIVRIQDGETKDDDEPWTVTTNVLLGSYDDNTETNGHFRILGMIQRIIDRFVSEPLLNHKYRAVQEMSWALQDEDTYPYYFGGVEIKFYVPKLERRDPFA